VKKNGKNVPAQEGQENVLGSPLHLKEGDRSICEGDTFNTYGKPA
jgi:hypothetical protein